MTAYQRDTYLSKGAQERLLPRKKEAETSMLQYSERMREINAGRVSLGDGLQALDRMGMGDNNNERGWANRNGAFMERRTLQRPDYCQPKTRDRREEDKLPQLGPVTNKIRRQRPLSFDEKELQHNIDIIKTRRRPYSFDERELHRNEAINAKLRSRHHKEAFVKPASPIIIPTSDAEESVQSMQTDGEVRISFVSASDLYELVDIKSQMRRNNIKSHNSDIKLSNVPHAVQFVHDVEPNKEKNGHLRDSLSLQLKPDSMKIINKPRKDRNFKINVDLNKDLLDKKGTNAAAVKDRSVRFETERVAPMGIFLQQAVSDFASQNALNVRPKRAKRMSLRKPRLLDIPEDGDSTFQPGHHDRPEPTKCKVRQPTSTSLQIIKEGKELGLAPEDNGEGIENGRLTQRPRHGEVIKTGSPLPNSKCSSRKLKTKLKQVQSNLDIDKLLMTSIYPTLPWDTEVTSDQPSGRSFGPAEKSSHKEKAHRKMKKLIFLRDRPEQHYRRDT